MCGRFALVSELPRIRELFKIDRADDGIGWTPKYNIAPTTKVPVAIASLEGPKLIEARWGLVPHWERDLKSSFKRINARSESVFEKPSYRSVIKKRRCLVPASGFYEWKKEGRGKSATKQPYFIHLKDKAPMAFAGVWTTWKSPEDEVVATFSVLTCTPNALVQPIHGRMPVILEPELFEAWLDPDLRERDLIEPMLCALPQEKMGAYEISSYVGNVKNQGPQCIEPQEAIATPVSPAPKVSSSQTAFALE